MPKRILTYQLSDYMPPECACPVEKRLQRIVGVETVAVDTLGETVRITCDPEKTQEQEVQEVLRRCGVECAPITARHAAKQSHAVAHHEQMKQGEHAAHEGAGHDHHAMMERDFRKRFFVVAALTAPILILSPTIQEWLGFQFSFPGIRYLLFVLASVVTLYGTWPFFKGVGKALRRRVLDMSVLVSIAVLAGYLFSVGSTFAFEGVDFYWEISTLVAVLLFGHWLEMRAVRGTSGALKELLKLIPSVAHRLADGEVKDVATSSLAIGDLVLVRPGEQVPVDGEVVEGESSVNEAMVTGESKPVFKKVGDAAIAGTVNGDGALKLRVSRVGNNTTLAQIVRLVREAQASKPPVQRLADRAAHWLTIIAVAVGLATFLFWFASGNQPFVFALTLAVTVLVIACPHALGLAIPVVTTISTTLGARYGMLIRNAQATESARRLTAVVFDKTGTLTRGEFGVTDVITFAEADKDRLLQLIAGAEQASEHTIAQGIVRSAKERSLSLPEAETFQAIPGKGAQARVQGQTLYVGNRALMDDIGVKGTDDPRLSELEQEGKTVVFAAIAGKLLGALALADVIREESYEAVSALKAMGVKVAMLTGDTERVAEWVGRELGLDVVFSEVKPEEKTAKIAELQAQEHVVAMVGDGINDAPAFSEGRCRHRHWCGHQRSD